MIGRPLKDNAISKIGHKYVLYLNQSENNFLNKEVSRTGLSKAEIVRRLIQKSMQE